MVKSFTKTACAGLTGFALALATLVASGSDVNAQQHAQFLANGMFQLSGLILMDASIG